MPALHGSVTAQRTQVECKKQIAFGIDDQKSQWIPTLSLPSTNNVFASSKAILWKESSINVSARGDVECSIRDAFVQSDDLWSRKSHSELFALEVYANSTYLVWRGNEPDARMMEGTVVQLKLTCDGYTNNPFCLAFRIAGVHVNSKSASLVNERHFHRVELIACMLLAILLALTIFGSVTLWSICWRIRKGKLISQMQLQFLYHMKQQQQYMQEQIAAIKVSCAQHSANGFGNENLPTCNGIQKRKLYFSADFFEPEMMANPPQLAQQFVIELRKMIEIAKDRIRLKRHVPTLASIVEEHENEHIEIPAPNSTVLLQRTDEPSPKSAKSSDSGCDSMSDDDTQTQPIIENCIHSSTERRSPSKIPVVTFTGRNHFPKVVSASNALSSRIPTITSSKMISPMTLSPRLPPKPFACGEIRISDDLPSSVIAQTSRDLSGQTPPPPPSSRSPPNLGRILSSVPPPLPDSKPPDVLIQESGQVRGPARRAYAVFPSDSMLKKSLPRRSKKTSQRAISPSAIETTM
uniref:Uncharacterized protein n=1 Tax=Parascaris univalens TaxID=6257 RepID=A0A914ZWX1_PARUN